jgi:hypothetical protein
MVLYWPQDGKKDRIEFGNPICNAWGQLKANLANSINHKSEKAVKLSLK